jgi:hypothetical protein
MTNDDLQLDVAAELSWDPKVDSQAIAVSADDGAVTLRGTVGSVREKREAGKAAARVYPGSTRTSFPSIPFPTGTVILAGRSARGLSTTKRSPPPGPRRASPRSTTGSWSSTEIGRRARVRRQATRQGVRFRVRRPLAMMATKE